MTYRIISYAIEFKEVNDTSITHDLRMNIIFRHAVEQSRIELSMVNLKLEVACPVISIYGSAGATAKRSLYWKI